MQPLFRVRFRIFILALTLQGVLALFFAASGWSGPKEDLLQFLSRYPEISIPFTQAPGRGHFATTALLMKQIREAGYRGKFHLYIQEECRDRVAAFLPGYHATGSANQDLPFWNADTRPLEHPKGEPISRSRLQMLPRFQSLGIVGGEDLSLAPAEIGVDALLVVQPSHWQADSELRVSKPNSKYDFFYYEFKSISDARIQVEYSAPENPVEWIEGEFASLPEIRGKAKGLQTLIRNQGNRELMTIYGLGFLNRHRVLATAISALRLTGRTTLVPILNDWTKKDWERFDSVMKVFKEPYQKVSIFDPHLRGKIRNLNAGEILLIDVGAVPQSVFHFLIDESTLPPLVEGNSAVDFLSMRGKPYFSTTGRRRSETNEVYQFSKRIAGDLDGHGVQAVLGALQDCKNPNSSISEMFKKNQSAFLSKQDKLVTLTSRIDQASKCNRLLWGPLSWIQSAVSALTRNRFFARE